MKEVKRTARRVLVAKEATRDGAEKDKLISQYNELCSQLEHMATVI